jgi:NAD(P) transhydrogenase subunit alpha
MTLQPGGDPRRGLSIAVVAETEPGERRVALVPEIAARLIGVGHRVMVESGAGKGAWYSDAAYLDAGAELMGAGRLVEADVVLCVNPVAVQQLHSGQWLLGLLQPLRRPQLMQGYAWAGVTTVSLDTLPRTLSQAQSMDALTSQANVAGYKAAVLAADTFGGFFPMLMTAAGTVRPAQVLVLGGGVAGLQAIGTASRLGAMVSGYDVRPEARGDIESLGARFVELASTVSAGGSGGYARALTPEETRAQQSALAKVVTKQDVVICTAALPGRRPPLLVTAGALAGMRTGSVVLDLAASELGGNVEGSHPDSTIETSAGVTVIGAGNLPSAMPAAASNAYAHNLRALLDHLAPAGVLALDPRDPISTGVVITHEGAVVHPDTLALLNGSTPTDAESVKEDPDELRPVH